MTAKSKKGQVAIKTLGLQKQGVMDLLERAVRLDENNTEEFILEYLEIADGVWLDIIDFVILTNGDLTQLLLAGLEAMILNEIDDVMEEKISEGDFNDD